MTYTETEHDRYLTTQELMNTFHVSRSTVVRLIDRGLPSFKIGAVWRFPRDKVLAWFEAR
jgi:excisionase family DNA binding protein